MAMVVELYAPDGTLISDANTAVGKRIGIVRIAAGSTGYIDVPEWADTRYTPIFFPVALPNTNSSYLPTLNRNNARLEWSPNYVPYQGAMVPVDVEYGYA